MKTRSLSLAVSPELGKVSAKLITPDKPVCVITLAHGAGAGMDHEFMVTLSKSLSEKGIATLRFNFPFMENNKRRPDSPAVAHKTIEVAIKKAHGLFPSLPVFASGKSFGGRMSSQYLATQPAADVKGLIFFWISTPSIRQTFCRESCAPKKCRSTDAVFAGYERRVSIL